MDEEPASPRTTSQSLGDVTRERRIKVARYMLHSGGPVRHTALESGCKIPSGSMGLVLNHPWFVKSPDGKGWTLTAEGRRAAAD